LHGFIDMNERGPCYVYKYSFSKIEKEMVLESKVGAYLKDVVSHAREDVRAFLKIHKILEF